MKLGGMRPMDGRTSSFILVLARFEIVNYQRGKSEVYLNPCFFEGEVQFNLNIFQFSTL